MKIISMTMFCVSTLCAYATCCVAKAEASNPPPKESVLIITAHPDDETIFCGGLIQQIHVRGGKVSIVTLTNGDADSAAAAIMSGHPGPALTGADYLELARQRQDQEVAALEVLAVTREDIYFLGYPDGGLSQVAGLSDDALPYTQPLTGKSQTYGLSRQDFHSLDTSLPAPYLHKYVLSDLVTLIKRLQPTQVYTHAERDWHPDHQATSRLVREALIQSSYSGPAYTFEREQATQFGASMSNSFAKILTLSDQEIETKGQALQKHVYQIKVAPMLTKIAKSEAFSDLQFRN